MSTFAIYQEMTAPTLVLVVTEAGTAIDVSDSATIVKLYVGRGGGRGRVIDGVTMAKDGPAGQVSLAPTAVHTTQPGTYSGQVEITWAGGAKQRSTVFPFLVIPTV